MLAKLRAAQSAVFKCHAVAFMHDGTSHGPLHHFRMSIFVALPTTQELLQVRQP